jgi:uncharacterized protein (DUF342 family)
MGVAYGIDQQAIRETIERATNLANKVQAVVAQGVLPVHGVDAKVNYRLPEEAVLRPLPCLPDGSIDYLQLDPARYVQTGQLIATVVPAQHGRPGRTLTFPPQNVPQRPGKEANLRAGDHVTASEDNLQFTAEASGYVYLTGEKLCVLPAIPVADDIRTSCQFAASLVLKGNLLAGAQVKVQGDAAIGGRCEEASLSVRGSCHLAQGAQRSEIAADGNILLGSGVQDCTISTRRRVIALNKNASLAGGRIVAFEGIEAYTIGTPAWTPTEVVAGVETCWATSGCLKSQRRCASARITYKRLTSPCVLLFSADCGRYLAGEEGDDTAADGAPPSPGSTAEGIATREAEHHHRSQRSYPCRGGGARRGLPRREGNYRQIQLPRGSRDAGSAVYGNTRRDASAGEIAGKAIGEVR